MKFLKYVIGIIIAISVIPIIIISIDKVTDPVDKTINFNIVYDEENDIHYLDPNVYDNLVLLIETENNGSVNKVVNLVSIKVDDVDILPLEDDIELTYSISTGDIYLYSYETGEGLYDAIKNDGSVIYDSDLSGPISGTAIDIYNNVSVSITFKVPSEIPPLVLVMLGLIPTVFISGILYVIFKKQNE